MAYYNTCIVTIDFRDNFLNTYIVQHFNLPLYDIQHVLR
jgi:hypothetical protein